MKMRFNITYGLNILYVLFLNGGICLYLCLCCQQANPKELKWQRGEVKMITANLRDSLSSLSPSGSGSLKVDPRLGSLWMLQVQLLPPKRARSDSELSTASNSSANNTTDPQQQTQQTYVAAEKSRLSAAPLRESDNNAAATFSRERSNSYNNMGGSDMVEGYRPGELLVCRNQAWGNRYQCCATSYIYVCISQNHYISFLL